MTVHTRQKLYYQFHCVSIKEDLVNLREIKCFGFHVIQSSDYTAQSTTLTSILYYISYLTDFLIVICVCSVVLFINLGMSSP